MRWFLSSLCLLLCVACNDNSLLGFKPPEPSPEPSPITTPLQPEYLGTEFFAVDLDNYWSPGQPNADAAQFAVAVSNPSATEPAAVTVSTSTGVVESVIVGPGGLEVIELPDSDVDDTSLTFSGYRVESDLPITAHQFNPVGNVLVYSNDASLLLPVSGLGREYRVASWPQTGVASDWNALRGFVVIAAVTEEPTEVTVTVKARTVGGSGIPAIPANNTYTRTLSQYEVMSLASSTQGHDLTGTLVTSTQPVAVFGGSECSNIPLNATACDHLEEQMFPVQSWGRTYVAAKSARRGSEPDFWRIIAARAGTTVTTSPPQPGTPVTLGAGEFVEIESAADFIIEGSDAILVSQYLVGEDYSAGTGDPAMMLPVPVEQFRSDYIFLTPPNYANDSVTLSAPTGSTVKLDGAPVPASAWVTVGNNWSRAVIDVSDGIHHVSAENNSKFGITVTGYDSYVSYGYPGGLNLEVFNP